MFYRNQSIHFSCTCLRARLRAIFDLYVPFYKPAFAIIYLTTTRFSIIDVLSLLFTTIYLLIISNLLEYLWVASRIISLSGDIEINPGPKSYVLNRCFSICHWNLNSILAHIFTKVSLLSAYISVHKFDIICLSETYLNSKIPSDDENVEIPGYNLVREDHSNSKRGGVCFYYKS